MPIKLLILAAVLAFPCAAPAQRVQDVLTLDEVVRLAVKNNSSVLFSEQGIIISKQRVREARFLSLPQFSLSGTFSRANLQYPTVLGSELGARYLAADVSDNFYTLRAYALQPLYTGGRNTSALRLYKTAHSQAKVDYETVKNDVVYTAKKNFYAVLYSKALNSSAALFLEKAEALSAGFKKDSFEDIEAQLVVAGLRSKLLIAKKDLEAASASMQKLLNREPGYSADVAGAFVLQPVREDLKKSLVTAMESRSEMQSEVYKAQMNDIAVDMAMFRRYPNVYLGASYDVVGYRAAIPDGDMKSNNWTASVAIQFPLSYDIWTQVLQRKAQQRQGDLKRSELQDNIRFEIASAYRDLDFWQKEAQERKTLLERLSADYERALHGGRTSMEAVRALLLLCDFEKSYFESVYNQLLARIKLEWAQGKDLSE